MASKSRGGLSKNEVKRAKAAQAKSSSKSSSSSRAVASKSVAPLVGAGPLMTGQARQANSYGGGSQLQGAGPLLPGQTRVQDSYTGGTSQRDLAARAQKSKSSSSSKPKTSLLDTAGDLLGSAGAKLRNVPGLKQIAEYGDDYVNTGNKGSLGKVLAPFAVGAAIPAGMFAAGAGAAGGLSSLAGVGRGVIGRGIGSLGRGVKNSMGEIAEGAAARLPASALPTAGVASGVLGAGQLIGAAPSLDPVNDNNSYNPEQEMFSGNDSILPDNGGGKSDSNDSNKKEDWVNPWGDVDISGEGNISAGPSPYQPTQEEITQQNNELYGGGQLPDTSSGTMANRSGRGSGNFGTGKGVMSDDPYIKELRKAYSSNGGEKWLRKQFEELIAALDPTYAQLQKEGEDSLNAKLLNDNTQLASVMNAGNVGDSEQRAQLMAQQQQSSQAALGNLLAKLAQNKAQDVSGYKSQQAEAMSKLQQGKQQDARTLLEKIQAYRGQQGQGRVAGPAVQKTPKLSRTEVFNWVEDALNKGYSWQEIADNAQEQGIGTETGGYLDQLLNQANKQNRYR